KKNITLLSTFFFLATSVQAKNWTGYYAGVNAGYNSGSFNFEGLSLSDNNSPFHKIEEEIEIMGDISDTPKGGKLKVGRGSFGVQLGHLAEADSSWVFGWELSLNRFKHRKNNSPFIVESKSEPYVHRMHFNGGRGQIKFDAKLKGIIGYKVKNDFLPYISLGASIAKIDYKIANSAESCFRGEQAINWFCENFADYAWARNQILSKHSYFNYGYNYGVGVFYALTDNISLNLEMNRNHLKPLNGYMGQKLSAKYTNYRLGLNYHF
ncbi:TPA: outer membrane protein, partial [Pasteurella multocida]